MDYENDGYTSYNWCSQNGARGFCKRASRVEYQRTNPLKYSITKTGQKKQGIVLVTREEKKKER